MEITHTLPRLRLQAAIAAEIGKTPALTYDFTTDRLVYHIDLRSETFSGRLFAPFGGRVQPNEIPAFLPTSNKY